MTLRCLPVFGLCFISTMSFAAALDPQAAAEYHAAVQAMDELEDAFIQLQALAQDANIDRVKGKAKVDDIKEITDRLNAHLDTAAAAGHAVAMYQKARIAFTKAPVRGNKTACELFGRAAEQGLVAGALEYAKCVPFFPASEEYSRRLQILQSAVDGQDPYQSEYPLLTAFPYCFPKHKPALQPGEDAVQWIVDNARPLPLSAEDFRAEGYYTLALTFGSDQPDELKAGFLRSAFAHGCREDSARLAKYLKVAVPPAPAKVSSTGS